MEKEPDDEKQALEYVRVEPLPPISRSSYIAATLVILAGVVLVTLLTVTGR